MSRGFKWLATYVLVFFSISSVAVSAQETNHDKAFLGNYIKGLADSHNVWPGYKIDDIPKLIIFKNAVGGVDHALIMDHPAPRKLGKIKPLSDSSYEALNIFWLKKLPKNIDLSSIPYFEFGMPIAGANTFVLIADISGNDEYMMPSHPEFVSLLFHEAFHRFQFDKFQQIWGDQDVNNYDFSETNLFYAAIEDKLLTSVSPKMRKADLEEVARNLIAIRKMRHERSKKIQLDEMQEQIEGSARYVEGQLGNLYGGTYTVDNYSEDLQYPLETGFVKQQYGFGRFYATGATMIYLMDLLELEGHYEQITKGKSPMQVMETVYDLSDKEIRNRFNMLVQKYASLKKKAEAWSISAKNEPDPFSEDYIPE